MTRPRSPRQDERGAVAVLVAVLMLVLIGVLAFVSDLGMAYANQRRLQNGADAAALDVGRMIALKAAPADCPAMASAYNTASSRQVASGIFAKSVAADASLAPGQAGFLVDCQQVGANLSTLVVKVKGEQRSPTFFGGIFGADGVSVAGTSRVVVGPLGTVVGLRPFAICEAFADTVRANPGTTFVVPVTQANAGCGAAPGNWAMMDFDGGANATGDMKAWIAHGYDEPVSVTAPLTIDGDPGFNINAAASEMDVMFTTRDVVLPVYNNVVGTGSNARYSIVGFVSVTPCRYRINNKTGPDP